MYIFGKKFNANLIRLFILALLLNLAACGTIMHPERKNQHASGQIDVGVAILDGIGLLFFIIPGVIAYAVDFSNNTIYLPHGHRYSQIHIDGKMDQAAIERAIRTETGISVDLNQAHVEAVKLESANELDARFASFENGRSLALAQ